MSFNIVSEVCTSIINTKLDAPPMDEPWFYELQNELNESVKKAEFWLNSISNVENDFRNIGSQMKVTILKAQQSEVEVRGYIDRLNFNYLSPLP